MKTTSYIIIGLLSLGAVGAFGFGAYVGHNMGKFRSDTLMAGGEVTDTQMERFAVLDTEVKIHSDSMRINFIRDLIINVTEDASLESPRLSMSDGWNKYLTVRESGDSLIMDFDFHGYMRGNSVTYEHDLLNQPFIPTDITITVPKGMLKRVNPDRYTRFVFKNMEADSLDFGLLTSMSFDKCCIGGLSFSGKVKTAVLKSDYGSNRSRHGANLTFDESQVGLLVLDVPVASISVDGEDSMIERFVWNDVSAKGNEIAYLNAPKELFRQFEWNSPEHGNTLEYQLNLEDKGKFSFAD